jgi:hypothetical protein
MHLNIILQLLALFSFVSCQQDTSNVPESQRDCEFTTSCGKICCSSVSCGIVKTDVEAGLRDHCGKTCPPHATSCGKRCCSAVSCGIVAREVADGIRDECGHYNDDYKEPSDATTVPTYPTTVSCPPHDTSCGKRCCSAVSCGIVAQEVADGIRDECGHYNDDYKEPTGTTINSTYPTTGPTDGTWPSSTTAYAEETTETTDKRGNTITASTSGASEVVLTNVAVVVAVSMLLL